MTARDTVLVTGANRGLGRHIAGELARAGHHVLLGCRRPERAEEVVREIAARGGTAEALELDVSDPGSIDAAAAAVLRDHGRLRALINNAAVFSVGEASLEDSTPEMFDLMWRTNAVGPALLTRALLPVLVANGWACVVHVTSDDAEPWTSDGQHVSYRMSKAALNAFLYNHAADLLRRGVAMNAVDPGWMPTDMGGADATDDVETSARLAVWAATLGPGGPAGHIFRRADVAP